MLKQVTKFTHSKKTKKMITSIDSNELAKLKEKAKKFEQIDSLVGKYYEDPEAEGDLTEIGEQVALFLNYI